MKKILDLITAQTICAEDYCSLGKIIGKGSYDIKRLLGDAENSYKHISNRYVRPDDEKIFSLIDEEGREYKCITNSTIFLHLGLPYNKKEAAYITQMVRRREQQWVKVANRIFYIKGDKPSREYLRKDISEEERKKRYREVAHMKYLRTRDHSKKIRLIYRSNNMDKINSTIRKYRRKKRSEDVCYKILETMRSRILSAIKGNKKSKKSEELLGCSISYAKKYIESLWKDGMSWENHGLHGWHIDHIKPCAAFDLSIPEQQKECFHFTNLQPLWAKENWIKGDKFSVDILENA